MAQYQIYTDGTTTMRDGIRENDGQAQYVIDVAVTATGFDGEEDTDWTCLEAHDLATT